MCTLLDGVSISFFEIDSHQKFRMLSSRDDTDRTGRADWSLIAKGYVDFSIEPILFEDVCLYLACFIHPRQASKLGRPGRVEHFFN